MTPDAALDHVAFHVGLRLMGPDARRQLRIALLRHPEAAASPPGTVDNLEHLDGLLDGRRQPATLQDRLNLAQAERERTWPPFEASFWLTRTAELLAAGFSVGQAAQLVSDVRRRVDPLHGATPNSMEESHDLAHEA
jgi:uncharacterized protein YoaH (UPF0181 family)